LARAADRPDNIYCQALWQAKINGTSKNSSLPKFRIDAMTPTRWEGADGAGLFSMLRACRGSWYLEMTAKVPVYAHGKTAAKRGIAES
jgi:hypothetical protein